MRDARSCMHSCPFWLFWSKNGWPWFTWWFFLIYKGHVFPLKLDAYGCIIGVAVGGHLISNGFCTRQKSAAGPAFFFQGSHAGVPSLVQVTSAFRLEEARAQRKQAGVLCAERVKRKSRQKSELRLTSLHQRSYARSV